MKNLIIVVAMSLLSCSVSAQTIEKGTKMVEVGANTLEQRLMPTGLGFYSSDKGDKALTVAANVGYFVVDNLAVKAGAGYAHSWSNQSKGYRLDAYSYSAGAEYYLKGKYALGVSWNGSTTKGTNGYNYGDASFVSVQLGYAWRINDKFMIKPIVKRDFSVNNNPNFGHGWGVGVTGALTFK